MRLALGLLVLAGIVVGTLRLIRSRSPALRFIGWTLAVGMSLFVSLIVLTQGSGFWGPGDYPFAPPDTFPDGGLEVASDGSGYSIT